MEMVFVITWQIDQRPQIDLVWHLATNVKPAAASKAQQSACQIDCADPLKNDCKWK